MRKLVINDATGLVVNAIEIEDGAAYTPPSGQSLVDAGTEGNPGDTYNSGTITAASATVLTTKPQEWAAATTQAEKIDLLATRLGYIVPPEA